jgi:hypothetical protein
VSDAPTLLSATIRGDGEAVLALDGAVGHEDVARMLAVLSVLLGTGIQHLIVDVSAASPPPVALCDALHRAEAELTRRGGWLLVEGLDGAPSELLDAFRAYQTTLG